MLSNLINRLTNLSTLYLCSFLFLFTVLCYANTLGNGLFFDDEQFIYSNQSVKTLDVSSIFGQSLSSVAGKLSNYYRPLLFLGFSIEYHLFGDTGFIYHLDSMFIHYAGGVMLFLLLKKLFKNTFIAFLTSLLFLIHPVQTEAVSYASGRGDPLSFFFVLLTILLSLSSQKKYKIASFFTLICAFLSKELALITPGLIFISHLWIQKSFSKKTFIKSFYVSLPYGILTAGYFLLRISVLNFANTLNFYNTENIYSSSLFVRLNTFFHTLPTYVQLIIFPKELFMERDSGISVYVNLSIQVVITLITALGLLGASVKLRKSFPIFLFALLWIAMTFIPTSGIIPINGIFYEHFLYYPSVGFFLIFSTLVSLLIAKASGRTKEISYAVVILIIVVLCTRTIARNTEWHDPITFYLQTLRYVQSPRAYNNLAMAYAEMGDNKNAIAAYKNGMRLSDSYAEPHYNLANSYLNSGDIPSAEKEYKAALTIDPTFYFSYIQLSKIYTATNNKEGKAWLTSQLNLLSKKYPSFIKLQKQLLL